MSGWRWMTLGVALAAIPGVAHGDVVSAVQRADQVSLRNLSYHYDVPFRGSFAPVIASVCTHKDPGSLQVTLNPAEIGFPYLDLPITLTGAAVSSNELVFTVDREVNGCFAIPQADGTSSSIWVRHIAGRMHVVATELNTPIRTTVCGAPRSSTVSFTPVGGDLENYLTVSVNLGCGSPALPYDLQVQGFTFFGNMSVAPPVEGALAGVTVSPSHFCQHTDARAAVTAAGRISLATPAGSGGVDVSLTASPGITVSPATVHVAGGTSAGSFQADLSASFGGIGSVVAQSAGRVARAEVAMELDLRPSNSDDPSCAASSIGSKLPVIARPPPYRPGPDPDPAAERMWKVLEALTPAVKPARITVAAPVIRTLDTNQLQPTQTRP